jgi:hypothetical protein
MSAQLTGGCLCGAIRYTVSHPIAELRACHCTHCQKASGASGSVNAVMPAASLAFTRGAPKMYADTAQSGRILNRYFCGDCGSPIYSRRANTPEIVVVRAGSFDAPLDVKIACNIWTASARPWAHIDPDSEQHPGNMPPKA